MYDFNGDWHMHCETCGTICDESYFNVMHKVFHCTLTTGVPSRVVLSEQKYFCHSCYAKQCGEKKKNKYAYVRVIQVDLGQGYEDVCEYRKDEADNAHDDLKEYRASGIGTYRIIHRRVKNA